MIPAFQITLATLAAVATAASATAAEKPAATAVPVLNQLHPIAVAAGATTTVTAVGKFAPWPPQVWTNIPGITFHAGEKIGEFNVEVGPDVPVGPHLIRMFNEKGASAPRLLVVVGEAEPLEAEPNDEPAKATVIARLPVTFNGRLNKTGDVDSFAIPLEPGQTLIASLDAYVLGSPVDAVLRLLDPRGLEVAFNHDNGRNHDPALAWTAESAGTHVLQVFGFAHPATADVRFTGSDACVYRLHLSRGPHVRYTLPLGVTRATPTTLRAFGWNLAQPNGCEIQVNGATFPADATEAAWCRPEFENSLTLPVGEGPEWLEQDFPAHTPGQPAPAAPFAVTGCIDQTGQIDRFRFSAAKDEKLVLTVHSASLGFPLDAWLSINDPTGKELVRNDDGTNADPVLEWTAPETGIFTATVGSVLQRAGNDHLYRLSIQPPRPRFQGIVAEPGFTVAPGKSTGIKVTARRIQGFQAKLVAEVTGLPAGVTAEPIDLGGKEKEVTIQLKAAADASPWSGPIQIRFREANSEIIWPGIHELTSTALRNGVPQGFRDLLIKSTDQIWLTVLPAPSGSDGTKS